jgi:hypothetical protein
VTDILRSTTLIVEHDDVAEILTEALCRYSAFDKLAVEGVEMNAEGNFVVSMEPVRVTEKAE